MHKTAFFLSILLVAASFVCAQNTSTVRTSTGREFWVMFLDNQGDQTPHQTTLTAIGDSNASITVSNPSTGWNTTVNITAGQSVQITVPLTSSISHQSNTSQTKHLGLHVTSSSSINLYAKNYKFKCNDATLIIPSHSLGTQYIMQDYQGDVSHSSISSAEVGFVATQNNTILTMVLPCNLMNNSATAGDTLTVNLMCGESYQLIATTPGSFSGMEVTSNGKPFAAFQGNRVAYIPTGASGADLLYEQAIPVEYWGTDYVVLPTSGRNGDQIRITSSEDNCQIYANGTLVSTLQKGETFEDNLSGGNAKRYTCTQKVCVGRYLRSNSSGGNPGDPSSVMIPDVTQGCWHIRFELLASSDIENYFINIVARNEDTAGITLDGLSISHTFTPIDTAYCFSQIAYSASTHVLESPLGPVVAECYGLGYYASYAYMLGRTFTDTKSSVCPEHTTAGRDFWMMFLYNHNIAGTYPQNRRLYFASTDTATVNVHNNLSGNDSFSLTAPDFRTKRDYGNNQLHVATAFEGGYHITSSSDIWLYARNWMESTLDMAMIMPTEALGTRYIVQDYPSTDNHGGEVGFVATQDSTILTMTVPCAVQGTSITAGTTLTVPLNQGQAYMLLAVNNGSFSGMEVTSNNKPFAMFQGSWNNAVPQNANARDHCYEQALPVKAWGKEFIFGSIPSQSSVNHVRITTTENNTIIQREGASNIGSLPSGTTWQGTMSNGEIWHLTSSHPIQVILYMGSCDYANNIGDPSSVTILPLDRTICDAYFCCDYTERIGNSNHYVNIVCHEDYDAGLILDGNPIGTLGTVTVIGNYRYHTVQIPYTNTNQGFHRLQNNIGPFWAFAYGYSYNTRESYAFPLGCEIIMDSVPEPQIIRDTVNHYDTVCQGHGYNGYGFDVTGAQTAVAGNIILTDSTTVDDTLVRYTSLTLTVLPNSTNEVSTSIVVGDTLVYCDSVITLAGDYIFTLTAANGCDSIIMLHITYQTIGLSASANGVCPGEEVTLTAEGTHIYYWGSTPYDPELDSQQGENPITVHPEVTTTYQLLDASGNIISSVTVGVEPPPTLCIETNRDFIDFDHPVITLHDCSPERYSSTWTFSDGYTLSGERARRQFAHPLPDTVTVTLHSCNHYDCCNDTTIGFSPKIRSVWFPNIFTPNLESNNHFGPVTSCQVADFEIFLYNRWGLLVWHSTDINTPWDGTHDGCAVPQGAYAYRWYLKDVHGDRWSGTGTVTLIR
jgi:gliding motility-associated-like protein